MADRKTSTKTPRKLEVIKAPFAMWQIHFEGGGRLPKELAGYFTNEQLAQNALDMYEAEKR